MKKIILLLLASLLAAMIPPTMAATNVCTVNYLGDCNTAYITISSGTITVELDDVKDFNISVRGYTTATLDINSTHVKITRDGNYTNTVWNITNANYDTIRELLDAMAARSDITIVEFDNITDKFARVELFQKFIVHTFQFQVPLLKFCSICNYTNTHIGMWCILMGPTW